MTSVTPSVSIVVCTRNGADCLHLLFSSLTRLPDEPPWEAIIVDNASTDATQDTILAEARKSGRIKYAFCGTIGLGAARDMGWRAASAPIVAFTDDDCSLCPDYVRNLIAVFGDYPDAGFIGGRLAMAGRRDANVINLRTQPKAYPPYTAIPAGDISGANHAFRRAVLEATGGYDRALGSGTPFSGEDKDAVAAASWAGFGGRFDPRPVIVHHSRTDDRRVFAYYDRGRGAYYMKYILRPDSRSAYLRLWLATTLRIASLPRLFREIQGAISYLWLAVTRRL